jgi:hypothetical protein
VAILFLGAVLRFYKLDFQSIWLDEIHSMNEANPKLSFTEIYSVMKTGEQMPPLYFYTLHYLFVFFGYTTFVARMFSAVIGVMSIYYIYVLGKELVNKEMGLIAGLLLSLNTYHLYYSQEARPYGFLMLFTIIAFYRLVKYIKIPNRKNAVYYGIAAGIMILSHFFGLFVLLSQCFILLIFLLLTGKKERMQFFVNSAISGIVALILFIPAIKTFLEVSQIKQFWIPPTDLNTIKQIFKDFCGNSDFLLYLSIIALLYYVVIFIKEKRTNKEEKGIVENNHLLAFIILASWVIIVLAVPIIRSYLVIPMIISRYFIVILPGLILLISIAISRCNNEIVKKVFLSLLVIGALYQTIFQNKYYSVVSKTQFREVTHFIAENNTDNEPVVTSLPWYFQYYLNNDTIKTTIIDKPLDAMVNEMIQDSTKKAPFWYVDGHIRPYKVEKTTQDYLDKNFIVENNIDLYDTWTKHFVLNNAEGNTIDISKFQPLKDLNGDPIEFRVEAFNGDPNKFSATGWAFLKDQDATKSRIEIIALNDSDKKAYRVQKQNVVREDVTTFFNSSFDLSNSGFSINSVKDLPSGKYRLGILIKNTAGKKYGLVLTDKFFTK